MEEHDGWPKKVANYIAERAKPKLEDLAKKAEKERMKAGSPDALAQVEAAFAAEKEEIMAKFHPASWLSDAARRAGQICFSTHPVKFINSQSKGASSCHAAPGPPQPDFLPEGSLISTASLTAPRLDVDGNAAALDVASLLQLQHDGRTLLDCILERDADPLRPFASDEGQLAAWMEGFAQAAEKGSPSAHALTKQIYFPTGQNSYHLVSPLFSSSLAQLLHERIQDARFSESAKEARKAKRAGTFHESATVDYPNTAAMSFGGTKPQNISQLNNRRGGKAFLLSCAPPTWQMQSSPPLRTSTVFVQQHFGRRAGWQARGLRLFLESRLHRGSNVDIRQQRAKLVDEIMELLLQYGAEVQNSFAPGWSRSPECRLDRVEQLWLDPRRSDEEFVLERERKGWQSSLADSFAKWLNKQLAGKERKLAVGDPENDEWKSLLEERLRLLKDDLEAFA